MSELINQLTESIGIFLAVFFVLVFITGAAILFFFINKKKPRGAKEEINYDNFVRKDARAYMRHDDIIDTKYGGVIISNNWKKFTTIICALGYDLPDADPQELNSTRANMISFVRIIENLTTMRQSARAVDLTNNINIHLQLYQDRMANHSLLLEEFNRLLEESENVDDEEEIAMFHERLTQLDKEIRSNQWISNEIKGVIEYMSQLSGSNAKPVVQSSYVISWIFNPAEFSFDLTQEQIIEKGCMELASKANTFMATLERTGVTCFRMRMKDILETFRSQTQPFTSNNYRIDEVIESGLFEPVISSDSEELLQEAIEQQKIMQEYYAQEEAS